MVENVSEAALRKEEKLKELLAGYGSIAIAYSGGVDSTYLADVAHEVLGDSAGLILADSPSMPRSELAEAKAMARARGWNLVVVATNEFRNEAFLRNDAQRCYHCKVERFDTMKAYTAERDIAVVAHGENADDARDSTRVGAVAASERGVVAPLQEVGLTKDELRILSRRRNLPTWNKASFACLATRIPTGTRLDIAELAKVEQAEEVLKRLGFHQYRVRRYGDLARIEIESGQFARVIDPEVRTAILAELAPLGYRHITLDLAGYGGGTMG